MNLRIIVLLFVMLPQLAVAQTRVPDIKARDIKGVVFDLKTLTLDKKPLVMMFWATWCKPCIEEMDNIAEVYDEWQDEMEFELVAVCIDDSRSSSVIRSFAAGKDWPFRLIFDINQDIKRAMNVTVIPHYYLFNSDNIMVHKQTGYTPGNEFLLYNELKKLVNE